MYKSVPKIVIFSCFQCQGGKCSQRVSEGDKGRSGEVCSRAGFSGCDIADRYEPEMGWYDSGDALPEPVAESAVAEEDGGGSSTAWEHQTRQRRSVSTLLNTLIQNEHRTFN